MADYAKVRRRALWLLSRKNYHSSVLEKKLTQKGFSADAVERVMEDCDRMGFFQDDDAILSELKRGYGPRYIQYKLQISEEEVRRVVTRKLQSEQIEKMKGKLKEKEKAIRTLLRKGFDYDVVIEIFS